LKSNRDHTSMLARHHSHAATLDEEPYGTVSQDAAVRRIKCNGIGAAQLVPNVLVGHRQANAALAETALHFHLNLARQVHLSKPDVSVFVTFHVLQLGQLRRIQLFDESLRYDHHAMVLSQRTSLDDRAFD